MNTPAPCRNGRRLLIALLMALATDATACAETTPAKAVSTPASSGCLRRRRGLQVARLVGYQIDLEFEPGETFVGLGAGDIEGLAFVGQDNHLFLKPKAAKVATNLTVLTNRRHYHFDYTARGAAPAARTDVIYSLRFTYPQMPSQARR